MKNRHLNLSHQVKEKLIFLIVIVFVCCNFISCRKACFYKKLGPLSCDTDYISVSDANYVGTTWVSWTHPDNELVVINDLNSYKQSCADYKDSMPLGYIDFTAKTLVGIGLHLDMNDGFDDQGCFCYNPETKKYEFKIEYSLKDQCKGSGISSIDFFCYVICPKLPADAVVEAKVKNINPFN